MRLLPRSCDARMPENTHEHEEELKRRSLAAALCPVVVWWATYAVCLHVCVPLSAQSGCVPHLRDLWRGAGVYTSTVGGRTPTSAKVPLGSIATPQGALKRALAPTPSRRPALRLPARVVVTPLARSTRRTRWPPYSCDPSGEAISGMVSLCAGMHITRDTQ